MIKVAGYCRVSTDNEDQANSFASQQRFFREYIDRNPAWELYEIYADEGITGTSRKKRIQFNRMMHDAGCHRFQLIITKEISRFSRNILDTIACTRELKALGIGVLFLTDGFCTLDPDAELRLSILGSIAQEESRRTSSRVKWGQTRQMERGVVFGHSLLGYDVRNGKLSINPEGARIVKQIFYKYAVEKKGTTVIARELREAGLLTFSGHAQWSDSYILKILKNEKYVGDLVQKKTFTPDYLTHEKKYNHGQEALIILKDHHEPIISQELWDLAQEEIRKRRRSRNSSGEHSARYLFSGKIICAECGCRFIPRKKVRKDGSSYRRWGCRTAAREGTRKEDLHGNVHGCDVGKQLRDDLAADMLTYTLKHLDMDRDGIIRNLSDIVLRVTRKERESSQKLHRQRQQIREKKTRAIDRYLSGELSGEDFRHIGNLYDTQLKELDARITRGDPAAVTSAQLQRRIEAILTCKDLSEPFLKSVLESVRIHRDSTVEIKLNQLPELRRFQLYKGTTDAPNL